MLEAGADDEAKGKLAAEECFGGTASTNEPTSTSM